MAAILEQTPKARSVRSAAAAAAFVSLVSAALVVVVLAALHFAESPAMRDPHLA